MNYFDLGCNIKCWDCNKNDCAFREILLTAIIYPKHENEIFHDIIEEFKSHAGLLFMNGIDVEVLNKQMMETTMALYVAKQKLKEKIINKKTS